MQHCHSKAVQMGTGRCILLTRQKKTSGFFLQKWEMKKPAVEKRFSDS